MPKAPRKVSAAKAPADERPVIALMFVCGLFAAGYGLFALRTGSTEVITTASGGAQEMNPLTSILMLLAGIGGIIFSFWAWLTRGKKV